MNRKTIHIASLGFHRTQRVDYVIRHVGGNKLVILYSEQNFEQAEAVKDDICQTFTVELKKVDPWDYYDVLNKALEVVLDHFEWNIAFNPSLGTRVMTAALVMAAAYINAPIYLVVESDGEEKGIRKIKPIKREKLTAPKKKILETIISMGGKIASAKELGTRVELGASTISGHLKDLREWRYISSKINQISITNLGKTVFRLAKHWETRKKRRG